MPPRLTTQSLTSNSNPRRETLVGASGPEADLANPLAKEGDHYRFDLKMW